MASTDTYNTLMSRFKKPNRQSMDRQQMQGQVYNTPGVTAPAKPTLTEAGVEAEKNGTNGEVVQLGNSKPAATPATTEKPATATTPQTPAEPKPALTPEDTKPAMPGLKQEKIKVLEGVDTSPKDLKGWLREVEEMKRRMGAETTEQREKREKKEKAERIIAAIGDGVSALAQIHAAGNGAVVNQGTGTSLMEGVAKRHERLRRERDANDTKLLSYLRERRNSELAERKAKREEQRAEQAAKHQAAQEKYWESQGKRWEDYADHQRRQDEEKAREFDEKQKSSREKADKDRQSRERIADKNRAAANSRAAKAESGRNARHNDSENRKDKRAEAARKNNKSNTGNQQPKTKRTSKTRV